MSRRVLLQRPPGKDRFGANSGGDHARAGDGIPRSYARAMKRLGVFRGGNTHPIVRLTEEGIDWGVMPRPGDLVGYAMNPARQNDCWPAAIATCTQIPIEQVPDPLPQIERKIERGVDPEQANAEGWGTVLRWADRHGWEIHHWDEVPVPRERWIGVVVPPRSKVLVPTADNSGLRPLAEGEVAFASHGLVMSYDRLLFDPMVSIVAPPGLRTARYTPDEITYGLSFEPKERSQHHG